MCTSQEKLIGENRSFGNILQLKFSLLCPGTAFPRYWSLCFPTSAFSALYHLPPFHVVLIFLLLPYSLNLVCPTVIKMSHQDSDATWTSACTATKVPRNLRPSSSTRQDLSFNS